jgi:hypothetical protein
MNDELLRRLIKIQAERVQEEKEAVDLNPSGLSLAQIKELVNLSADEWQLVYDLEVADKKRPRVLEFVAERLAKLQPSEVESQSVKSKKKESK